MGFERKSASKEMFAFHAPTGPGSLSVHGEDLTDARKWMTRGLIGQSTRINFEEQLIK